MVIDQVAEERDTSMPDYEFVRYEELEEGKIVRILLDRPDTRNAQNRGLLVELDDAFRTAEEDDEVRVVILGGVGPLFSSGHDMGSAQAIEERTTHPHAARSTAPPGRVPRPACCRSGTTTSRTRCGGGTCARSPSPRCRGPCTPPA